MSSKQLRSHTATSTETSREAPVDFESFHQPWGNSALIEELGLVNQGGGSGPGLASAGQDDDKRELYLRHAQEVVTESNQRAKRGADPVWLALNGQNAGVEPEGGVKPPEWERGIEVDNNLFESTISGDSVKSTGISTIEKLRDQIESDLNFNHVFDRYTDRDSFVDALVTQFSQGGTERAAEVRAIAENLWAYGTTGADVNGRTDVGELQGLLFSLDPMIAAVSQSNTTHKGAFTIPGSQVELGTHGDDVYGRASMLECRLLASVLAEAQPERDLAGYDMNYLLMDHSSSMKDEYDHIAGLLEAAQIDGVVGLAGFDGGTDTLKLFEKGKPMDQARAQEILEITGELAMSRSRAWDRLKKAGLHENYEQSLHALYCRGGSYRESGLASGLAWLKKKPGGVDAIPSSEEGVKQQLVVVTDSRDYSAGSLVELQRMAEEKNVSVKVLFSDDNGEYFIVDVMKIDPQKLDSRQPGNYMSNHIGHMKGLDWEKVGQDQESTRHKW